MQKVFLLAVLGFSLLLTSCKEDGKDTVDLFEGTESYLKFNNGSTWTYALKSNTSFKENVTCTESSSGYSDPGSKNLEFFIYTLNSDVNDKVIVRAEAGAIERIDRIVFINYLSKGDPFYSPILWNAGQVFTMGAGDTIEYLNSYTVSSDTYNDVYRIVPKVKDVFKQMYIAKNIGIIEKTYANDSTFVLEDKTIFQ